MKKIKTILILCIISMLASCGPGSFENGAKFKKEDNSITLPPPPKGYSMYSMECNNDLYIYYKDTTNACIKDTLNQLLKIEYYDGWFIDHTASCYTIIFDKNH